MRRPNIFHVILVLLFCFSCSDVGRPVVLKPLSPSCFCGLFYFQTTFPVTPSLATSPSMAFSPYLSHMGPAMGLMPELLPTSPLLVPGSPTGLAAMGNGTSAQKHARTDKLEVCSPVCSCCVSMFSQCTMRGRR